MCLYIVLYKGHYTITSIIVSYNLLSFDKTEATVFLNVSCAATISLHLSNLKLHAH